MRTPMGMLISYLEASIEINKEDNRAESEAFSKALAIAKIYAEHERFVMGECFDAGHKNALAKLAEKEHMFPDFNEFIKKYE